MVDDEPHDWQDVWGEPRHGDWDLDDLQASLDSQDWEVFAADMADAYNDWLEADGQANSIPLSVLRPINNLLRDHDIGLKTWWFELYGR